MIRDGRFGQQHGGGFSESAGSTPFFLDPTGSCDERHVGRSSLTIAEAVQPDPVGSACRV